MKISKKIIMKIGVFPIIDYFYEPLFNPKYYNLLCRENRALSGLNFNIEEQFKILEKFDYNQELVLFPIEKCRENSFFYHNSFFESGDAEYLYNIIRLFKPNKFLEIGSGYSTLLASAAISRNKEEDPLYNCQYICIDPFGNSWLNSLEVEINRKKIEEVDKELFKSLKENDILFIDSSHIIRPQGDVLFEYLEILPILKSGVLVHLHDIFTPNDYPFEWLFEEVRFWNEQYLLEAFLSLNSDYRIIGSLNHLKHKYYNKISTKCPILKEEPDREPGSFWIVRN